MFRKKEHVLFFIQSNLDNAYFFNKNDRLNNSFSYYLLP